jgi:polyisoprenyl-phosphate glycosyltransferase
MTNSNHNFFSLIIPCYNESLNIPKLFKQIHLNQKKVKFETIIIDNGSTDNSLEILKKHRKKVKNLKILRIKNNIGFGHAVKIGILKSKYSLVCYTHGDLQVNIENCVKAYNIYKGQLSSNVFVKGRRLGRTFIDILFTIAMGLINTILFRTYLFDIHAQPNFFQKMNAKDIKKAPNDMSIDLYFYAYFKMRNFKILRFNIIFEKRIYGLGNNIGIKKITNSLMSFVNSIKILKNI